MATESQATALPVDLLRPGLYIDALDRPRLVMQGPTQALGHRQHPLTPRDRRQPMIGEVGRDVGHAPRVAGRTAAATLARAWDLH